MILYRLGGILCLWNLRKRRNNFFRNKVLEKGITAEGMQIPSGVGNFVAKGWLWTDALEIVQRAEVCELLEEVGQGWFLLVALEGEIGLGFSSSLHIGDRKEGNNSCPLLSLVMVSFPVGLQSSWGLSFVLTLPSASTKLGRVVDPLEFWICIFLQQKIKSK